MTEDLDNIPSFEAEKTSHQLPLGWVILFLGLIAWGIWYIVAFTPEISGWSQEKAYTESVQAK